MERACLPIRLCVETLCVYNQLDTLSTGREQKTLVGFSFFPFFRKPIHKTVGFLC